MGWESIARTKTVETETEPTSLPKEHVRHCRELVSIFPLDPFDFTVLDACDRHFLDIFDTVYDSSHWMNHKRDNYQDHLRTYVQMALAKMAEPNGMVLNIHEHIIQFVNIIPDDFSYLRIEFYNQFAQALGDKKSLTQMRACELAAYDDAMNTGQNISQESYRIRRDLREWVDHLELVVDQSIQLNDRGFLREHLGEMEALVKSLPPIGPEDEIRINSLLVRVFQVIQDQSKADQYRSFLKSRGREIIDLDKFTNLFPQSRTSACINLIKAFEDDSTLIEAQPYIVFINDQISKNSSHLSVEEYIYLADLSRRKDQAANLLMPERYLDFILKDIPKSRGTYISYRYELKKSAEGLTNHDFSDFLKEVLLQEQTYWEEHLNWITEETSSHDVDDITGKYRLLIKIAVENGFVELAEAMFHTVATSDRLNQQTRGVFFGEMLELLADGFLVAGSPQALDNLQAVACFSDEYLLHIGEHYSKYVGITGHQAQDHNLQLQTKALRDPNDEQLIQECEQAVLANKEVPEHFTQLAFLVEKVPPFYTQMWLKTGLLPAQFKNVDEIQQALLFLRKMTQDDPYKFSFFAQPGTHDAIRALTSLETPVLRDKKVLFYLSADTLVKMFEFLSQEPDQKRKSKLANFLRQICNQFPTNAIEGAFLCVSSATYQEKNKKNAKEAAIESIDWTDQEEQQSLRKAVNEIGSVTPRIYQVFRLAWLLPNATGQSTAQQVRRLQGQLEMYQNLLQKQADPGKSERFIQAKQKLEIELATTIEPLNEFILVLRELRQRLHENIPVSALKQTIKGKLLPYFDLGNGDQDAQLQALLVELVFLLYAPVGFTLERVKEFLGNEDEGLLMLELQTTQQADQAGLKWGSSEELGENEMMWNRNEHFYQTTLINDPKRYNLVNGKENQFSAKALSVIMLLPTLPSTFQDFLTRAGRSLLGLTLAENQRNRNIDSQSLGIIRNSLLMASETFGIWYEDNRDQLVEKKILDKKTLDQVDETVDQIRRQIEELLTLIKVSHDDTKEATKETVDIYFSKNAASFFAKASVGLCTAEDLALFARGDHFHLNFVNDQTKEIIANVQIYVVGNEYLPETKRNGERFLLIRGLNPGERYIDGNNAESWFKIFSNAAKALATQSGIANVYLVEATNFHPHTNRPSMNLLLQEFYGSHLPIKLTKAYNITEGAQVGKVYKLD